MNCFEVQQLLSAYFDNELPTEMRGKVDQHVDHCASCADELTRFQRLSLMAGQIDSPAPPSSKMWEQLSGDLGYVRPTHDAADSQSVSPVPERAAASKQSQLAYFGWGAALAAVILVGIALGRLGAWSSANGNRDAMAVVIERYLEKFRDDPMAAQSYLLSSYKSEEVGVDAAAKLVGYRPTIGQELPDGYAVESIHVLKMPCCTCVECFCSRKSGTSLAIFEHHKDATKEWFEDGKTSSMVCEGVSCKLATMGSQIVASWENGPRGITIVGLDDKAELDRFVAWFGDRRQVEDATSEAPQESRAATGDDS